MKLKKKNIALYKKQFSRLGWQYVFYGWHFNIITGWNNITLRKVYVKTCRFNKMYMDKDIIEDKLYQIIDHFTKREFTPIKS